MGEYGKPAVDSPLAATLSQVPLQTWLMVRVHLRRKTAHVRWITTYKEWARCAGPTRILLLQPYGPRKPYRPRSTPHGWRAFGLDTLPAVLIPPAVFSSLLVTLWTYKCLMMMIFQNKIIYMPSVPPFSRSEQVADYASYASRYKPAVWKEHVVTAGDSVVIKLLEGYSNWIFFCA